MPDFTGSSNRRPSIASRMQRLALPSERTRSTDSNGRNASVTPPAAADAPMLSEEVRRRFRWRTSEGELLTLEQMETRHVFHALNWCWGSLTRRGHVAYQFDLQGRGEVGRLSWHIVLFCAEIDRRGDLPALYETAYRIIRNQVAPRGRLPELPEVPEHLIGGEE